MHTKLVVRRKRSWPDLNASALMMPIIVTLLVFMVALAVQQSKGISLEMLTEDASSLQGNAWFLGLISTAGICLLAAAAGIAFFAGNFRKKIHGGPRKNSALMWLSVCSLMLLADDSLMIHETVAQTLPIIPEAVIQAIVGLIIIATLLVFYRAIGPSFIYAAPALVAWTVSVSADMLSSESMPAILLIEDGSKFLGIILWFAFILDLANRYFVDVISARSLSAQAVHRY